MLREWLNLISVANCAWMLLAALAAAALMAAWEELTERR